LRHLLRAFMVLLFIALTACSPKVIPTLSPTSSPTAEPTPTAAVGLVLGNWHDMVYHEQAGQVVLVNGGPETGKSPIESIELWGWDGQQWNLLSKDPNGPRWRNFASIAYDSIRNVMVLYGGLTAEQEFKDTWEWDGDDWIQFSVEGPGARESAGMAFDSERGRMVIFGGAQSGKMVNDTWEWDGISWTKVASDGPLARFPAGFAYDVTQKNVVLFGGHSFENQVFTTYGDTWIWNGSTWQQISTEGPSPRDGARAIFVPASDQILLFGGAEISASVINLNDTWFWDGAQWEQAEAEGPTARVHPAMAFDQAREVVVMTGGSNGPGAILTDTWEWDGLTWVCVDRCE
jgi:hypothetical protein